MQNVLKSSNRSMLRTNTNYSNYLFRCRAKNNETLQQCLNQAQISRLFRSLSHNTLRQIQKEYKAVRSLIIRSGIFKNYTIPQINQYKYLRTSSIKSQDSNPKQDPESSKPDPNKKHNEDKVKALLLKLTVWTILTYGSLMWILYLLYSKDVDGPIEPRFVSWNEFVHQMLAKGEVKQVIVRPELDIVTIVLHDGAVVKGKRSAYKAYHMTVPNAKNIEEKIREAETNLGIKPGAGIPVSYERSDSLSYIHIGVLTILTLLIIGILSRSANLSSFPGNMFTQMTQAKFTLVDPLTGVGKGVRFSDVAGLQEAKTEVMELVDYLKNPDHYQTLGAKVPKGALLLGPPGCGKTLLAKAVATEANVPFLSMNGSEFIEMLGGLGAARVRDLFKEGKKRAPSIIYIDEIDAIGQKRSQSGNGNNEREQTLNQLLTEMDGMLSNQEVIVLASTNRAEVLDKALLRRGRFDRHILIDLPTLSERKQIFEQHLKGISLEYKPTTYSSRLAVLSPGFSGADIANVCNESALHAARLKKKVVTGDDLLYAIDRLAAGIEKRENTISPLEKRMIAYHESGHALIGWLLEHTDALLKVTIVPRTNRVLGFAQYTGFEKKLQSKEQLLEFMCMLMGGRVAESLTFNKIATGAKDDLEKVTTIAYKIVQQCGMDEVVGPLSFSVQNTDTSTKKPYSKKLANLIDQEVRKIVAQAYLRAEKILKENQDKLNVLAEELLKKESLTYEEIEKLIGPPPFGKKHLIDRADFDIPSAPQAASPPPP